MNGARFTTGKVGQAFSFDGVDDYVQIPDSPSLNPTSITVEAWFNPGSWGGNGAESIVMKPYTSPLANPYYQYGMTFVGYGYWHYQGYFDFEVSVGGTNYSVS
jgi:hypothetical protein